MVNRSGRKGAGFERQIADDWRDRWDDRIDRRVKTGAKDKGDLANVRIGKHRLVVECKNVIALNLSGWVDEAQKEAENDNAIAGIVIHKRVGKGAPGDQYVTLTLDDLFTILYAALGVNTSHDLHDGRV